jgi:hypothetical protein
MILSDGQILDSVRFNALVADQETNYKQNLPLRFLDRCETVQADVEEITATFTGQVFIADLVTDDAKAVVYEAGKLELVTNTVPNLKVGVRFNQAMIDRLGRIRRNLGSRGVQSDVDFFQNWETATAAKVIRGVNERKNMLICAMMLDNLTYNRLGVKVTGTWGMPANLKVTPSTLWTDPAATPITDTLTLKSVAAETYGEVYDKITMAQADFLNAVKTTEFKALMQGQVMQPLATTAFNSYDPRLQQYFMDMVGMRLELEDKTYTEQASNGSKVTSRVLPLGKVLLSVAADENDVTAYDFGSAVVVESIVAGIIGDPDNVPAGEQFGPFAYYTGNMDLNPPNLTAWGVTRGFPRKHRKTCTAVLTVR